MKLSVLSESKLLARHSMIYGLGVVLNQAVALLLLPLYTHYLSVEDYGVKELISITMSIISMLTTTAISSAVFRFYFDHEETNDRNEVISTSILSLIIIGSITFTLIALISKWLALLVLDSSELYYFFIIATGSLWIQAINGVALVYLRAEKKSLKFITVSVISLICHIGFNIFFIVFLKIGVLGIFISTLISSALMLCYLTIPLVIRTKLRFSISKMREMVRFGIPMIPSSIGAFVVHSSDRFFIKAFCSIGDAGLYSLGYRFGILPGTFISQPFNQVWMPRRLEVYKKPNAEKTFGRIFTYFLYLILFAGLGISVLTKEVLEVIAAPEFWDAYRVVPIIVLANIIFTMHYHFNIGIVVSKKTKYFALINFSNGILVLGSNTILIKNFGVYGAAYATLIAFVYKVTLTYYFSNKFYKIHFEAKRIIKLLICAGILYSLCQLINTGNVYLNGLTKIMTIMTYPILLNFLKFYSVDEIKKAKDFIKTKISQFKIHKAGTIQ